MLVKRTSEACGNYAQSVGLTRCSQKPGVNTLQIGAMSRANRGGGLIRYFVDLIRELPAHGVTSHGLITGELSEIHADMPEIRSVTNADDNMFARSVALRARVREQIYSQDLVVSHFAPFAIPILNLIKDKPLVVHFHGPWALESQMEGDSKSKVFLKRIVEKVVYRRASSFIVLSEAYATLLHQSYGVARAKIVKIPGGVDLERFLDIPDRLEARGILGWPTDRKIVLAVRRLARAKGINSLIEATRSIRSAVPDVLIQIAGTGSMHKTLESAIVTRQLQDAVRMIGFVPDRLLPIAYAAADLVVVPTLAFEGFGLVVVESLAAGTPVLVTPIGGLPEVVADLDSGLIMSGSTPEALAEAISNALVNLDALPSAAACRAYAERFDWRKIAGEVSKVYRSVVEA